jgi:hypothetical protein
MTHAGERTAQVIIAQKNSARTGKMKGAQTFANYVKQDISEYAGNPLIELPPHIVGGGGY